MAYKKNATEITTVLCDINKNSRGDVIRLSKIESDKGVSYDIRQMYTDDNDELQFTSKGVRVSAEIMDKLVDAYIVNINGEVESDE